MKPVTDAVFDTEQTQINRLCNLIGIESATTRLPINLIHNYEQIACPGHRGAAPMGHDVPLAEGGAMMNGGMWGMGNWMGGDGGIWVPVLIAIVVVGFVAWFVKGRGK